MHSSGSREKEKTGTVDAAELVASQEGDGGSDPGSGYPPRGLGYSCSFCWSSIPREEETCPACGYQVSAMLRTQEAYRARDAAWVPPRTRPKPPPTTRRLLSDETTPDSDRPAVPQAPRETGACGLEPPLVVEAAPAAASAAPPPETASVQCAPNPRLAPAPGEEVPADGSCAIVLPLQLQPEGIPRGPSRAPGRGERFWSELDRLLARLGPAMGFGVLLAALLLMLVLVVISLWDRPVG